MLKAFGSATVVFAITFVVLMVTEKYIHKITHNPYKNYKWGVWLFSVLLAGYAFIVNIGVN